MHESKSNSKTIKQLKLDTKAERIMLLLDPAVLRKLDLKSRFEKKSRSFILDEILTKHFGIRRFTC